MPRWLEYTRRRSPGWVRALDRGEIHALALHLRRLFHEGRATARQDWLFDATVSELEYRNRHPELYGAMCVCELCVSPETVEAPPFDWSLPEEDNGQ